MSNLDVESDVDEVPVKRTCIIKNLEKILPVKRYPRELEEPDIDSVGTTTDGSDGTTDMEELKKKVLEVGKFNRLTNVDYEIVVFIGTVGPRFCQQPVFPRFCQHVFESRCTFVSRKFSSVLSTVDFVN